MKIIDENNLKVLIAEEGYFLKQKDDVYKEAYTDDYGNQIRDIYLIFLKKHMFLKV